jgi:hypothetical protein
MGACISREDKDRERSARIDRSIEEDAKRFKKECKILLLGEYHSSSLSPPLSLSLFSLTPPFGIGSGESGKSTIVKQMKIIHQNGYSHAELLMFRPTIYRNLLESAEAVVLAMRKLEIEPALDVNRSTDVLGRIELWCKQMRAEGWWGGERGARGALMWQEGELESEAAKAAHPGNVTIGNFLQAGVSNNGDIDGPIQLTSSGKKVNSRQPTVETSSHNNNNEKAIVKHQPQDPDSGLSVEIAQAVFDLFSDPMFKYLVEERSGEFYMMDSGV